MLGGGIRNLRLFNVLIELFSMYFMTQRHRKKAAEWSKITSRNGNIRRKISKKTQRQSIAEA